MNRRQFLTSVAAGTSVAVWADLARGTAMAAEDTPAFCFAVVADPHCAEGPKEGLEKCGTGVDKFLNCVRAMERLEGTDRPDFILLAGDVHPDAIKDRIAEVRIPIHATAGNHESDADKRKLLRSLSPGDFRINGQEADYYSFVHKGVQFISMCDAGKGGEHVGQLCSEIIAPPGQCEWLEQELAAPEPRKILFAHIPPERNGQDRGMCLNRNDSRWFNNLVRQTQPTAMFFGHLHRPTEEYAIGRTRVFIVRSCCWNFDKAPIGFLHVRISADGIVARDVETGTYA